MKKTLSLVLALVLLLSLAIFCGCSAEEEQPNDPSGGTTQTPPDESGGQTDQTTSDPSAMTDEELMAAPANQYVPEKLERGLEVLVAWDAMQLDDQLYVMMTDGWRADLEPLGFTVMVSSFEVDPAIQKEHLENYLTMGCAVYVTAMNDPDSGVELCALAEENGCYFIQQGSVPNGHVSVACNVDQEDIGRRQVEMSVAWIDQVYGDVPDGSIHVAFIGNTTNEDPAIRTAAVEAAIAEDPRQQLVFTNHNSLGLDVAYTAVEEAFTYDPEIRIVYTFNVTQAIGANNYIMSLPGIDVSQYAVFANGTNNDAPVLIEQAAENGSVLRGTIAFGGDPMWGNVTDATLGLLDGSIEPGLVIWDPNWPVCSFDFSY